MTNALAKMRKIRLVKTCSLPIGTPILALTAFAVLLLAGCGRFFRDADELVSISVSPANSTLQLSKTQQFMAIGAFGDSSSRDISSSVNWKSTSGKVALVNSSGMATAYGQTVDELTAACRL